MICEDCRQRPASVHFSQSVGGQKTELHLCSGCANRRGGAQFWVDPNFMGVNLFSQGVNLFSHLAQPPASPSPPRAPGGTCPSCGLGYQQFLNSSLLGCPDCYAAFREPLDQLMRQFQAGPRHQGKIPLRQGGTTRLRRRIQQIRGELQQAVEREQFERAATLRDEMRALERQGGEGKGDGGA